jgi:dephospho-CoA kinase
MFVLGIAGDVGAGKSTVCRLFEGHGAVALDADSIVRDLWERSFVLEAAKTRWGNAVVSPDGRADKKAISRELFSSDIEYRWLCDFLHPLVRVEIESRLAKLEGIVFVEVPLLFESPLPWWADGTVYVGAPAEVRGRRNTFRGLDETELSRRERFLLPREEKRKKADFLIENDGEMEDLETRVRELWATLLPLARIVAGEAAFGDQAGARSFGERILAERLATAISLREYVDRRTGIFFVTEETRMRRIEEVAGEFGDGSVWAGGVRRCSCRSRKLILKELGT